MEFGKLFVGTVDSPELFAPLADSRLRTHLRDGCAGRDQSMRQKMNGILIGETEYTCNWQHIDNTTDLLVTQQVGISAGIQEGQGDRRR